MPRALQAHVLIFGVPCASIVSRGAYALGLRRIRPPNRSIDFLLEQVVEIDEVALVDRVREAPVAARERFDREQLVEERAGALEPREAVQAVLIRAPQVERLARMQRTRRRRRSFGSVLTWR